MTALSQQICYNCRKEGHGTADCPDPEVCRRCRKEGHKVAECPEPQICNRCGAEGHMVRECTEEEKTRAYTDEEGKIKEIYVPKEEGSATELYSQGISSGINFSQVREHPRVCYWGKQTSSHRPVQLSWSEASSFRERG